MIKSKKLKELEMKVFELEARIDLMEISMDNLIKSQGISPNLDAQKWYQESIDN